MNGGSYANRHDVVFCSGKNFPPPWKNTPKMERPGVTVLFFPSLDEFMLGHKEWLFMFVVLQQNNGTESI